MTAADAESAMPWGAKTPSRYSEYMQPTYTPAVAAAWASNAGPASRSASCGAHSALSGRYLERQFGTTGSSQGTQVNGLLYRPLMCCSTHCNCCQPQQ